MAARCGTGVEAVGGKNLELHRRPSLHDQRVVSAKCGLRIKDIPDRFGAVADRANRNGSSDHTATATTATGKSVVKKIGPLLLVALLALADGGCSYVTKSGRQQAAYARYIRHSSYNRMKLQRKLSSSPKIRPPKMESEPTVATSTGPESVTTSADSAVSQN